MGFVVFNPDDTQSFLVIALDCQSESIRNSGSCRCISELHIRGHGLSVGAYWALELSIHSWLAHFVHVRPIGWPFRADCPARGRVPEVDSSSPTCPFCGCPPGQYLYSVVDQHFWAPGTVALYG